MSSLATPTYSPGLAGVIAAQTRLSHIDGERGELTIGGFPLLTLAQHAAFEEVVCLLWHDTLPTHAELADFRDQLAARRALPGATLAVLREAASNGASLMDMLRIGAGTLPVSGDTRADAMRALASFPVIVAAAWRITQGYDPLEPQPELDHVANYLWMLTGQTPDPAQTDALNTYLIAVIDHGLNASTFTARVIASTGSDLISAVVGAVGALKGPLHGGAPGPALDMVFEIGSADRAEAYLREKLERRELLMGFGHRVYKVRDPRADALGSVAERLYRASDQMELYDLARHVESVALRLLAEYKPGRQLFTNVEFYTALLLHGLRLPTALFAPTFAVSRVGGWTAHCFEQIASGKIMRPTSGYTGDFDRTWIALADR